MRAWVRKGSLESFEDAQSNAYNYMYLEVNAFPKFDHDIEIEITKVKGENNERD